MNESPSIESLGLNRQNYERFFAADGASFLFGAIYAYAYNDLGSLVINDNGRLTVYLNRCCTERSRGEGLRLLSDAACFDAWVTRFRSFLHDGTTYFAQGTWASMPLGDSVAHVLHGIDGFLAFYRWTEFFYTDAAYAALTKGQTAQNGVLSRNLRNLENVKTAGRLFLNGLFNTSTSALNRLVQSLSDRTGVPVDQFLLLTPSELRSPSSPSTVSSLHVDQRRQDFAFASDSGTVHFFSGDVFEHLRRLFERRESTVLRGVIANGGFVRGRARVLDADFRTFEALAELISLMSVGEILVAETTSPDLVLACAKASGIVTNQGGLGSHAAIISRERGIPCVVGTSDATRVIKTGDVVELDADNGIVRVTEPAILGREAGATP